MSKEAEGCSIKINLAGIEQLLGGGAIIVTSPRTGEKVEVYIGPCQPSHLMNAVKAGVKKRTGFHIPIFRGVEKDDEFMNNIVKDILKQAR